MHLNGRLITKKLVGSREMVTVSEYSTAYGLEPEPESVVVVCLFVFLNIRHRDTTGQRINTCLLYTSDAADE